MCLLINYLNDIIYLVKDVFDPLSINYARKIKVKNT